MQSGSLQLGRRRCNFRVAEEGSSKRVDTERSLLAYRSRPPRNADNGSKEETVSCITTEISIGKAGQQWINNIKELQCCHLIELVIISGRQPCSG